MVQILPAEPTFGSEFGKGLGEGIATLPERLDKFLTSKREKESLKETLKQLGLAPELSQLPPELQKEFIKQKFQKDKLTELMSIIGGLGGERGEPSAEGAGDLQDLLGDGAPTEDGALLGEEGVAREVPGQITDQQILATSLIDPTMGKLLQSQKDARLRTEEAEAKRKFTHEETREARAFKRSQKYLDQLSDIAKELPKEKLALQQMKGALDQGDFNSWRNIVGEMTGFEALKTSSAQAVNSAIKQFLMSSLAGLTGRPNQFIEKQITKALISPLYKEEANILIYEGLEGLHKLKKREGEIAENLEESFISRGKEIPRNFQKLVRKEFQKETDAFEKRYEQRVKQLLSSKDLPAGMIRMRDREGRLKNVPKEKVKQAKEAKYTLFK